MSETLTRVRKLVAQGAISLSDHAYDKLIKEDMFSDDLLLGLAAAIVVEDYPAAMRGPSVLVLQRDFERRPIHVLWGIPKGLEGPAVIITAYRPEPARWSPDFTRRNKS